MSTYTLIEYMATVPDPRMKRRRLHHLGDILFIALCADVQEFLDALAAGALRGIPYQTYRTLDAEHGRQETRQYWFTGDVAWLRELHGTETWPELASIGMMEARRPG